MRAALALLLASGCHLPTKTTCRDNSDCNAPQVCVATVCTAEGDGGTEAGSSPAPDARVFGSTREPVILVSDQGATRMVVDDAAIYWTNSPNGTVSRKSLVTGELTVIASDQLGPVGIAIDSERVYWVNRVGNEVRSAPLRGGTISTLATGQRTPNAIAVDAGHLYWTDDRGVRVAPKTGGPPTPFFDGQFGADELTLDDERVYWTAGRFASTVWSAGKGGAPPVMLALGQDLPTAVAVDADTVYWTVAQSTAPRDGRVMKTARDGGTTPVVVAESLHGANNIVVDANHLYVALTVDHMILRLSKDGREKTVWATDLGVPVSLAIDATTVYWSTGDGRIMKMSK